MAHLLDTYSRVHEQMLCPKCGRADWCLVRNDGKACICRRIESGKPMKDAGWMHYLPAGEIQTVKHISEPREYLEPADVDRFLLASELTQRAIPLVERQARQMGLDGVDLYHLQVHYHSDHAALAFPMYDAAKQPIGVRFRRSDGRKWSLKGGREGIFRPRALSRREPLWIAEGPTDAAALRHLGWKNVIGRPSCMSGGSIIQELLAPSATQVVLIVADPDEPGINGAARLANVLPNPVVVIAGPADLRDFVLQNGLIPECNHAILESLEDREDTQWKAVHTNTPGKFYPFGRHFEKVTT